MGTPCRLLIDPPASGDWNMAVDEMLLERAGNDGGCCWRFYRWVEPTLSLGYFQQWEDRLRHAPSAACPIVRRASGGGAILHDRELTYSIVVPADHRLAVGRQMMYDTIHQTLIELFAELGIEATLYGAKERQEPIANQPFLCFQRRSAGDIVVGTVKIVGSAQRRTKKAVLQHGSVLLDRSEAAPELDALNNLVRTNVEQEQLIDAWLEKLSDRLALEWERKPLFEEEKLRAEQLVREKYGSDSWTKNRNRLPLVS